MVRLLLVLTLLPVVASAAPLRRPCHGRKACEAECTAGVGASCRALGKMIARRAAELSRRGCALGDDEACDDLYGHAHDGKWSAEARRAVGAATKAARRGCDGGDALACRSLAALVRWSVVEGETPREALSPVVEHARDLFRRGCDAGDMAACTELASALSGAVDMNDHIVTSEEANAAWPIYEKACAGGNGEACSALEWHVPERFPRLSKEEVSERRWQLMNEACDQGNGPECERAGDQAEYHGAEALPRYLKGCALDDAASCGKVAWCYGDGRNGVERDAKRALPYAETSCDADYASGCDMLARLLRPTDPARAAAVLKHACRLEPYLYDCPK